MESPRLALSHDARPPAHRDVFWRQRDVMKEINAIEQPRKKRAAIVGFVWKRSGFDLKRLDNHEVDTEDEYERFRSRITAAERSLDRYAHDMLVEDILQRVGVANEISGATDPAQLMDMMATIEDERMHFEVRRLFQFGMLFQQYEHYFGRETDLHERLHELEMFLGTTLLRGSREVDADLFHKVKDTAGHVEASSIRLPKFDNGRTVRLPGENQVKLTLRQFHDPAAPGRVMHTVMEERIKDPFSAALKVIRKGVSMKELRDIIGLSFFVDQREKDELQHLVSALEAVLPFDAQDRQIHPLRRAEGVVGAPKDNPDSGEGFDLEKGVVKWTPHILFSQHKAVDEQLRRFYSSPSNIDTFWRIVGENSTTDFPVEIQAGTLKDWLNSRLSGGDENHRVYKDKQARRRGSEDARSVLNTLYPAGLYGIEFDRDEAIAEALRRKQLAGLGLHYAALEKFDRANGQR